MQTGSNLIQLEQSREFQLECELEELKEKHENVNRLTEVFMFFLGTVSMNPEQVPQYVETFEQTRLTILRKE
jgi:hypothetical protein